MAVSIAAQDVELLVGEHQALMRHVGRAQVRCSEQLRAQAEEIARLRAETMRLRARLMLCDTALAWEFEGAPLPGRSGAGSGPRHWHA